MGSGGSRPPGGRGRTISAREWLRFIKNYFEGMQAIVRYVVRVALLLELLADDQFFVGR